MKKIVLICFGKLKTPGLDEAVAEFTKRLSPYTQFSVVEMKSTQSPEKDETLILERLEKLKKSKIWALDETGKALKTTEWAKEFTQIQNRDSGELVFIIGGAFGLTENILKRADQKISFGPQTLSHELARLVLVEQLYRALSYSAGHPYHNEG